MEAKAKAEIEAKAEALAEAKAEALAEAKAEALAEAKAEALAEAKIEQELKQKDIDNARKLKAMNIPTENIVEITGLSLEQINSL